MLWPSLIPVCNNSQAWKDVAILDLTTLPHRIAYLHYFPLCQIISNDHEAYTIRSSHPACWANSSLIDHFPSHKPPLIGDFLAGHVGWHERVPSSSAPCTTGSMITAATELWCVRNKSSMLEKPSFSGAFPLQSSAYPTATFNRSQRKSDPFNPHDMWKLRCGKPMNDAWKFPRISTPGNHRSILDYCRQRVDGVVI